jgi:hypothetical protein
LCCLPSQVCHCRCLPTHESLDRHLSDPDVPPPNPYPPFTTKPTNSSLQVLQRELYANARAIHSARSGGAYGHLAIIMLTADYIIRAGVAFDPPVHPGNAPVHGANATSAQITETISQYAADLAEYNLYHTVNEELIKQVLATTLFNHFWRCLTDIVSNSERLPSKRYCIHRGRFEAPC